jgi:hypothetical protein
VVVRLGKDVSGEQIQFSEDLNHISVWCEDFAVDFGNAALVCDGDPPISAAPRVGHLAWAALLAASVALL